MRWVPAWAGQSLSVVVLSLLTACGGSYNTTKVKNYRLSLVEGDKSLVPELKTLVEDFNRFAGITVLQYVDDPGTSNSPVAIIKGLEAQTRRETGESDVGLGQYLTQTTEQSPFLTPPGQRPKREISYSMSIKFDYDYMAQRSHYDQQKLFFHEVGHGLEMDHSPNVRDVMYSDVGGAKDFEPFFAYVRAYMQDQ